MGKGQCRHGVEAQPTSKSPTCVSRIGRHKDGAPVIFQHVVPLLRGRTTRSSRCGAKVEISRNDFQGADLPRRLLHGSTANGTKIATLRMGITSWEITAAPRSDSRWDGPGTRQSRESLASSDTGSERWWVGIGFPAAGPADYRLRAYSSPLHSEGYKLTRWRKARCQHR